MKLSLKLLCCFLLLFIFFGWITKYSSPEIQRPFSGPDDSLKAPAFIPRKTFRVKICDSILLLNKNDYIGYIEDQDTSTTWRIVVREDSNTIRFKEPLPPDQFFFFCFAFERSDFIHIGYGPFTGAAFNAADTIDIGISSIKNKNYPYEDVFYEKGMPIHRRYIKLSKGPVLIQYVDKPELSFLPKDIQKLLKKCGR